MKNNLDKVKAGDIVKVLWRDVRATTNWQEGADVSDWARDSYDTLCETLGRLIERKPEYAVFASSDDGEGNTDAIMIPCALIADVVVLEPSQG